MIRSHQLLLHPSIYISPTLWCPIHYISCILYPILAIISSLFLSHSTLLSLVRTFVITHHSSWQFDTRYNIYSIFLRSFTLLYLILDITLLLSSIRIHESSNYILRIIEFDPKPKKYLFSVIFLYDLLNIITGLSNCRQLSMIFSILVHFHPNSSKSHG